MLWELGMSDLTNINMALGAIALTAAIAYGAWHEFTTNNRRDAKLLAAIGAIGLIGSTAAWLQ